jgi:hypothetical protein
MEAGDRYTTFSSLPEPSKDIKTTVESLFSNDWSLNFEAITELRSFLKFKWEEFSNYFTYLRPRIMQLAFSIRSTLAKNSLMFLSELFSCSRPGMVPTDILDLLLSKSASEKSFLKSEILTAIQNICENFTGFEVFLIVLSHCSSKSLGICKVALGFLEKLVGRMDFHQKFEAMVLIIEDGKRQELQALAKKFLIEVESDSELFRMKFENLPEKSKKKVLSLTASKSTKKESLKEMLKQRQGPNKENFEIMLNQ